MDSDEEDKESLGKQSSIIHIRTHSSEDDVSEKDPLGTDDIVLEEHPSIMSNVIIQHISESPKKSRLSRCSSRKLSTLKIPKKDDLFIDLNTQDFSSETILDGYEAAEDSFVSHQIHNQSGNDMSDDEEQEHDKRNVEDTVSKKSIFRRINSHKGEKSFQLGRQLSCKWTTGAGPRIGCLRDYPMELQSHALEQANLSPKSAPCNININKVFCSSPCSFENKSLVSRNCGPYRTRSSPIGDFTKIF